MPVTTMSPPGAALAGEPEPLASAGGAVCATAMGAPVTSAISATEARRRTFNRPLPIRHHISLAAGSYYSAGRNGAPELCVRSVMLVCSARRAVGRHEVVQFAVPLEAAAHMGPRRDPRGVGIAADDGVENRLMLRADHRDRKSTRLNSSH